MLSHARISTHLILILSLALTAATSTVRAGQSLPGLNLYISDAVPADSAARHAAIRFANNLSLSARLQIHTLPLQADTLPRTTGLVLAPLQQWQHALPALTVLRLPFYYPDLNAVHHALDEKLGKRLARMAEARGWKLLTVWDDGMTDFSGNQEYTKLPNLSGMQFALWQADTLQQMELRALNSWSRIIRKNGVQRNAQQCIVDSRSTTPRQMWREHLQRVHLDLTLTHDRYDGYVMAIPSTAWHSLTAKQRQTIQKILRQLTRQERLQATQQQQQALTALQQAGMQVHPMSAAQRRVFLLRMPLWQDFLTNLDNRQVAELLAAARTAATGTRGRPHQKTLANTLPGAGHTE